MCCAADEVGMGEHSSLGPIDPQYPIPTPVGSHQIPAHSIIDQFEMAKADINTEAELLAWLPILRQYAPGLLARCDEAIRMSKELVDEWAYTYMHADKNDPRRKQLAEQMAEFLSDRSFFKSHSRRINRDQAQTNGFDVSELEADDDIQDMVLSVYHAAVQTHRSAPIAKIIENQNGRVFYRETTQANGPFGGEKVENWDLDSKDADDE